MRSHLDSLGWKIVLPALAAAVLVLIGTMVAIADQVAGKSDKSGSDQKLADTKVTVAGVKVAIDPKTGRLRPPTPEESRALGEALRQRFTTPSQPLQAIQAENGALALELPEEFDETAIFRTYDDGTQAIECMSAAEAATIIAEESAVITLPANGQRPGANRTRRVTPTTITEKE